jgi:hypothetical protein
MNPAMILAAFSPRLWLGLGAAAAAALVLAFAGVQSLRVAHIKGQLAHARAAQIDPASGAAWKGEALGARRDLADCRANAGRLQGAIDRQNAAVRAMGEAGARAAAAAQLAIDRARAEGAGERATAAAILAARQGARSCADADALILRSLDVGRGP